MKSDFKLETSAFLQLLRTTKIKSGHSQWRVSKNTIAKSVSNTEARKAIIALCDTVNVIAEEKGKSIIFERDSLVSYGTPFTLQEALDIIKKASDTVTFRGQIKNFGSIDSKLGAISLTTFKKPTYGNSTLWVDTFATYLLENHSLHIERAKEPCGFLVNQATMYAPHIIVRKRKSRSTKNTPKESPVVAEKFDLLENLSVSAREKLFLALKQEFDKNKPRINRGNPQDWLCIMEKDVLSFGALAPAIRQLTTSMSELLEDN